MLLESQLQVQLYLVVTSSQDLVVASAGDDKKISLWRRNGQSMGTIPLAGNEGSENIEVIASIGLDKKLYTLDSGSRRPVSCISNEAPFSSLAFRDDGNILAAGTSSGRVVFYDVRGKPQPFTVLRAYGNSEAVTSMCWQRSKPVIVNENNSTADIALLGVTVEDSVLMPDPLPSMTSSNNSISTTSSGSRSLSRPGPSPEPSPSVDSFGSMSSTFNYPTTDESPFRSTLWTGGTLGRLKATRSYNLKDDMDLFSPVQEVKPITPDKLFDDNSGTRKNYDKKSSLAFPSSLRFPLPEEGNNDLHPISGWKFGSNSKQVCYSLSHEIAAEISSN